MNWPALPDGLLANRSVISKSSAVVFSLVAAFQAVNAFALPIFLGYAVHQVSNASEYLTFAFEQERSCDEGGEAGDGEEDEGEGEGEGEGLPFGSPLVAVWFAVGSRVVPSLFWDEASETLAAAALARRLSPDRLPPSRLFRLHSSASARTSTILGLARRPGFPGAGGKQSRTNCEPPLNHPSFSPERAASALSSSGSVQSASFHWWHRRSI